MRVRGAPPARLLLASAGASALLGGAALTLAPAVPVSVGLAPATVTAQLLAMLPAGASAVRVNGLYGSLVDGSWEFVAHLSWRGAGGVLHGGSTALPDGAGGRLVASPFSAARLAVEERIGWTPATLAGRLRALPPVTAGVALVDFSPLAGRAVRLTWCAGAAAAGAAGAHCVSLTAAGATVRAWMAPLAVTAGDGPLSVRVRGGTLDRELGGSGPG